MRLLALVLTVALVSCGVDDAGKGRTDDPASGDDSSAPTWEGCADWSAWQCSPSGSGCGATCEDWQVACSPGTDSCNWSGPAGSGSCDDYDGSECDACEWALVECVRDEM